MSVGYISNMKPQFKKSIVALIAIIYGWALLVSSFLKFDSLVKYSRLGWWRAQKLRFGVDVVICSHVVIRHPELVVIGNNVAINEFVHIWAGGGVQIGDDTMIASHCVITSQTHSIGVSLYRETLECKRVVIGKNVWIGAGSIILPGMTIGDNSVIGAGSVVTKNVPEGCVVAGVPAQILRKV